MCRKLSHEWVDDNLLSLWALHQSAIDILLSLAELLIGESRQGRLTGIDIFDWHSPASGKLVLVSTLG